MLRDFAIRRSGDTHAWLRYAAAVALAVALLLLCGLLEAPLQGVSFSVPIAATVFIALALGTGPGLTTALLTGAGIWFLFLPPRSSFALASGREAARIVAYLVASVAVVGAIGLLHRTRQRLATAKALVERALADQKRLHEDTQHTAWLLQALSVSTPDSLYAKDHEGRVLFANPATLRVLGKSAEQVLGRSEREWCDDPEQAQAIADNDREVMRSGRHQVVEEWITGAHGPRLYQGTKAPLYDDDGRVVGLVGVSRDITELTHAQRTLREERDFIEAVLDTTASVVVVIDGDGRMLRCNKACVPATGYAIDELVGRPFQELVAVEDRPRAAAVFARLTAGESPVEYRGQSLGKGGLRRLFDWSIACIPDESGGVKYIVSTGIDITDQQKAESELRHAAELLDFGDAFFEVDSQWRLVRVNPNLERLSQKPRSELLGGVLWELWPEAASPKAQYWREFHRCMAERVPVQFEEYYAPLQLWTAMSAYPTTAGGIVGFVRDIGDRKRAEEARRQSEEHRRLALKGADLGTWDYNLVRGEGFFDERYRIIHGIPGSDSSYPYTKVLSSLVHPEDAARVDAAVREATGGGGAFESEYRVVRPDRAVRWVSARGEVLFEGAGAERRAVRFVGTVEDVTARKSAELGLREANAKLQEADQRKNEFLGMLSHELRNPLAPIRNSLYVLDHTPPGGPQAQRAHQIINRQVSHLSRLVDDLLDVTRISRGKIRLQRERVELAELVRRSAEDHREMFSASGVELELQLGVRPPVVRGDPTRLAQVVGNLLTNAVKFTPRGGRVALSLEEEAGTAVLSVCDNGAGLSPELVPRLFVPFVQADTTLDRSKGGLGLGLALVKGLVELHGGTVSAASAGQGQGARFTVRLPLEAATPRASGRAGRSAAPRLQLARRVLVIEDNADAAESLKEALELNGHEVQIACTGTEGIEKARSLRPDVVLCDLGLPGMDGFEVARRMRRDPELHAAPLVALSGYAAPEDLERSRDAGFVKHMAKPPDMEALEKVLAEATALASAG